MALGCNHGSPSICMAVLFDFERTRMRTSAACAIRVAEMPSLLHPSTQLGVDEGKNESEGARNG